MSISSISKKNTHILAIPWPATGHILPMIDVAHQLALRGITITFAVTPKNLYYLNPLKSFHNKTTNIQTLVLPLPSHPLLPAGSENMQDVTQDYFLYMVEALSQLHHPIIQWFKSHPSPPVAILTDAMNTTWTHPLASVLGIKTISFLASNQYIASTVWSCYKEMKKEFFNGEMLHNTIESWGIVLNSFSEIHNKSFDAFKAIAKHDRVWGVSPLLPVQAAGSERGGPGAMPSHEVLAWLDSCPVDKSVVYVAFGTEITLNKQQMEALGDALEKSGVRFIWAVKKPGKGVENESGDQSVVPNGFEDRVAGRGLVIKGWVPQSMILKHRAVGSYLSHLGWGSLFDGLMGGVLLLTWPMRPDHFMNKQLIVDELGAAIPVCEGLDTVPDSGKVAQILADSLQLNRPERIAWMKIRDKALNAAKQGGSAYKALDDVATHISNLTP
ncbi:hypothetical protein LWI29_012300 [Acer saccharum]|uniref:Uncharacterized protein n=1 Tax=Acer saccharum TaxID=4024 RepID=A0AA39TSJ4_ACESA|nr:hypothetical protein LWI29_012300 [Acer saccharum]